MPAPSADRGLDEEHVHALVSARSGPRTPPTGLEKAAATAGRYAHVHGADGTPLLWSAEQLIPRPEPRRLLIVVTDGDPAEREECAETMRRCWAGGIEVLGLGIKVPGHLGAL